MFLRSADRLIRDQALDWALRRPLRAGALITLGNYVREMAFAWYWGQKNRPRGSGRRCTGGCLMTLRTGANRRSSRPTNNLMRRLNRWRAPRWFRWWMLLATRAGDGWLWGLIGIAVLFFAGCVAFSRHRSRGLRGRARHRDLPQSEARGLPHAAARYRAALLGADRDARQVFISVGPLDDGVRGRVVARFVLSRNHAAAADARRQRGDFERGHRNAFPKRRTGWVRHGRAAGLRRFSLRALTTRDARHMSCVARARALQGRELPCRKLLAPEWFHGIRASAECRGTQGAPQSACARISFAGGGCGRRLRATIIIRR